MTIEEARDHIGWGVVYQPRPHPRAADDGAEEGEIVRVNFAYVFVLYRGDRSPKATRPEDLRLLAARPS